MDEVRTGTAGVSVVTVPRQRTTVDTGRYGDRRREAYPPRLGLKHDGLLRRAAIECVSGAAFCAGFLTVAALTALVGMWLL